MKIYQQTTDYTCEACSIMNLLRYKNILQDSDLTQEKEMEIADAIGTTDPEGADTAKEMTYLRKYFKDPHLVLGISLNTLDKHTPCLVLTKLYGCHWMVYIGDNSGILSFLDSAEGKILQMNEKEFLDTWYDDKYYTDFGKKTVAIFLE